MVSAPMLAALHYEQGFDVSTVLAEATDRLRQSGFLIGGLLQEAETKISGSGRCATLQIVDLRSGQRARITQNRGKEARGCKLDEQGLVSLSHCIDEAVEDRVDLMVISRFGRAEAAGGGLLASFSRVVCAGVPLLTAVRPPYLERWGDFHGGLATELPPSADAIIDWFVSHLSASAEYRLDHLEASSA